MSVDSGTMAPGSVNRRLSLGGVLQQSGFVLLSKFRWQEEWIELRISQQLFLIYIVWFSVFSVHSKVGTVLFLSTAGQEGSVLLYEKLLKSMSYCCRATQSWFLFWWSVWEVLLQTCISYLQLCLKSWLWGKISGNIFTWYLQEQKSLLVLIAWKPLFFSLAPCIACHQC